MQFAPKLNFLSGIWIDLAGLIVFQLTKHLLHEKISSLAFVKVVKGFSSNNSCWVPSTNHTCTCRFLCIHSCEVIRPHLNSFSKKEASYSASETNLCCWVSLLLCDTSHQFKSLEQMTLTKVLQWRTTICDSKHTLDSFQISSKTANETRLTLILFTGALFNSSSRAIHILILGHFCERGGGQFWSWWLCYDISSTGGFSLTCLSHLALPSAPWQVWDAVLWKWVLSWASPRYQLLLDVSISDFIATECCNVIVN